MRTVFFFVCLSMPHLALSMTPVKLDMQLHHSGQSGTVFEFSNHVSTHYGSSVLLESRDKQGRTFILRVKPEQLENDQVKVTIGYSLKEHGDEEVTLSQSQIVTTLGERAELISENDDRIAMSVLVTDPAWKRESTFNARRLKRDSLDRFAGQK